MSSRIFNESEFSEENFDTVADNLTNAIVGETLSFMSNLDGVNDIFTYELIKVISHAMVLGSVSAAIESEALLDQDIPSTVSEILSEKIAFHTINKTLQLDIDNQWDLKRLAESVSFGTSTGAQLAAVLEKSRDFTPNWEAYERKQLAKSTAKGSSLGSIKAKFDHTFQEFENSGAASVDEIEAIADPARKEIIEIAKHSSMGSLIGTVGMSIYFPNPLDRLALINFSSQGATTGSVLGVSQNDLSPEGSTTAFDVEIARASSNGATFGAVFQTTALTDANPRDSTSDSSVVSVVQAATYGSTFGAISAGNEGGSPTSDALIFKQATKQGSIEGSLSGASLGMGTSAENIDEENLRSRSSIIKAAAETNTSAASDANSNMATKSIRTSTSDMLLLMKKFKINPRLTNPTRIFKSKSTKDEESDFPFEEKLEVASPI